MITTTFREILVSGIYGNFNTIMYIQYEGIYKYIYDKSDTVIFKYSTFVFNKFTW